MWMYFDQGFVRISKKQFFHRKKITHVSRERVKPKLTGIEE